MNYYKNNVMSLFKNKEEVLNFYAKGDCVDLVNQHDESYFKDIIKLISQTLQPNSKLLDLGCGSGNLTYLLSKNYNVVGLDLNPFPKDSKLKLSERCQYVRGDALNLPFKENSFDAVIMYNVIEHIEDVKKVFVECQQVLKVNGIVIIISPCLITPIIPLIALFRLLRGREGIPVWGESLKMCIINIFRFTLFLYHKIVLYWIGKTDFRYRLPDLRKAKEIGGDTDAIYWANPFDIIVFLRTQNFDVIEKKTSILQGLKGTTRIIAKRVI